MRTQALHVAVAAALAISLLAGCNSSPRSTTDDPFRLQLLHFADVDGGGTAAMFNVDDFSALVEHFRSQDPSRTILLSSGDNYIPGPIFEAGTDPRMAAIVGKPGQGRGEITIQNRLGVQVAAVGNHDLDTGPAGFAGIIRPDGDYPGAVWPYLSVNIDFTADSNTASLLQEPRQEASSLGPVRWPAVW
jgi:5'-nucleotidase / UDP-sugar diphosphatase